MFVIVYKWGSNWTSGQPIQQMIIGPFDDYDTAYEYLIMKVPTAHELGDGGHRYVEEIMTPLP